MTYKEKWEQDHPGKCWVDYHPGKCWVDDHSCPRDENGDMIPCPYGKDCLQCWDQEVPEEIPIPKDTKVKADEFLGIKDSGDRTQFETGAVRDMREGKGRCDLMPLEVVAEIFHTRDSKNYILAHIANFKTFNDTCYLYMALEECGMFSDWETMFLEVAKHFEEGAKKYGENNWQKGIPAHCYIDSAIRHYLKWKRGDKDEPHDRAFVWNIMCCIWEVDHSPRAKESES
jgi:hypothetical protein